MDRKRRRMEEEVIKMKKIESREVGNTTTKQYKLDDEAKMHLYYQWSLYDYENYFNIILYDYESNFNIIRYDILQYNSV